MQWRGPVTLSLTLVLGACLGPNPRLEEGAGESTDTSGDGDGDPSSTGDGDGDGDPNTSSGDGDGEPTAGDPCQNGVVDGDETDIDCGGSCSPCPTDGACLVAEDCESGVCAEGSCAAPSCSDMVANGTELDVDCGGSCRMCEYSALLPELSDTIGGALLGLDAAMAEDGSFAIAYVDFNFGAQLRWFDELGGALGPATSLAPPIAGSNYDTLDLSLGPAETEIAYLAVNGTDPDSTTKDAFLARVDGASLDSYQPIYQGPLIVGEAGADVVDEIAAMVWSEAGEVHLRRHDHSMGVDLGVPLTANPEWGLRPGERPTVVTRDGLSVVAWVACDAMDTYLCDIELRRFDGGWLDNAPIVLGLPVGNYFTPRLAIGADGRVALTAWRRDQGGNAHAYAAIFNADFSLDGWWLLQGDLVSSFTPSPVVAALSDGSFAIAWSDPGDERIHLRRYLGADLPLVEDVGDEAPWSPGAQALAWVALATAGNHLAVTWTTTVNGTGRVQGQVLAF